MGRASKIGAHFGLLRAGPQPARVAASLRAPISRPMAAPAQTRSAALVFALACTLMDAAIAGLIGSLGGVIVGAAAQAVQAARSRRWQVADHDRAAAEQQDTRLWQERRTAYAAFMDAEMDATEKINWAWLINATGPSPEERSDHPVSPEASDALRLASEAISKVTRLTQEVLLITNSAAVQEAARSYNAAMRSYDPSAAHRGNPNVGEQGQALVVRLAQGHTLFAAAAREELRIGGDGRHGLPLRRLGLHDDDRSERSSQRPSREGPRSAGPRYPLT
jgi:hypothetical protein